MPRQEDALLVLTAAYTGLRAGELHALRIRDVDLLRGKLRMDRALKVWKAGAPEFGPTKSGKGRVVPLARWLKDLLATRIATHGGGPDSLVFTNSQGGAVHQVAWPRNHFKPAVKRALPDKADYEGGKGLRFHDLRHPCASLLIANGAHLLNVKEWLGHASVTTMEEYAHLAPDRNADLAAATPIQRTVTGASIDRRA